MIKHLANPCGPQVEIELTNPAYISPEEIKYYKDLEAQGKFQAETFYSSFNEIIETAKALYGGNIYHPTYMQLLPELSYCGTKLERIANPAPQLLWNPLNYTLACNLLDLDEGDEACSECIIILDQIRDSQGYRPVLHSLQDKDGCDCATRVLMRRGCKCNKVK